MQFLGMQMSIVSTGDAINHAKGPVWKVKELFACCDGHENAESGKADYFLNIYKVKKKVEPDF